VWQVIWAAAFILFGLVLFTVMPEFSRQATNYAERIGASLGLGVLVGCGAPIAAVIACVTVVGLFLGLSTFFLWYASLYFAQIIIGALLGQWLMGRTSELWPLIGRMIVGLLIVRLCFLIPHIGGWLKLGVIIWGIGAISLAIYRRMQPLWRRVCRRCQARSRRERRSAECSRFRLVRDLVWRPSVASARPPARRGQPLARLLLGSISDNSPRSVGDRRGTLRTSGQAGRNACAYWCPLPHFL